MKKFLSLVLLVGLMVALASPAFAAESINEYTGENSFNNAVAIEGDFAVVVHLNDADVDSFSLAVANSGFNLVGGVGGANTIGTGGTTAGTKTGTFANSNISVVEFDHVGPFVVDGTVARNSYTGIKSHNTAMAFDVDLALVYNDNEADVDNFSVAIANSGFNFVSGPGGANSVDTGDAQASTETFNLVNTNWSEVTVGGSDGSASAVNEYTGYKSINFALAASIDAGVVVNFNDAEVDNDSFAIANSGFNSADGAGGKNSVETGWALASTETGTVVNTNISDVSVDGGASSEASNSYTGEKSTNTAVGVDVNAGIVVNDNEADVDNFSLAVANTGANSASGAGGGNSVSTGNASATTETCTVANTNISDVSVDGGASSEASNSYTGKDSTNTAVGVSADAAVVVNENDSTVENDSVAVANTGANSASGAGGDNSVSTGNASATTETGTVTNTNVTTINGDGGGFPLFP